MILTWPSRAKVSVLVPSVTVLETVAGFGHDALTGRVPPWLSGVGLVH